MLSSYYLIQSIKGRIFFKTNINFKLLNHLRKIILKIVNNI